MKKKGKRESGRAEKVRLIIFVCEIIATGVIPALLAFWDQMTLSVGVALLTAHISVMFLVSQFMENQFLSEIQEKQDDDFSELSDSISALRKNLDIEEARHKIFNLVGNVFDKEYIEILYNYIVKMNCGISICNPLYYYEKKKKSKKEEKK